MPNQQPRGRLFCSLGAAAWSIRVVVDVDDTEDEPRVGVIIVESIATVCPCQEDGVKFQNWEDFSGFFVIRIPDLGARCKQP